MTRLERILVVVDRGMRTTPALRRGAELARRASAALQLCLFDHQPLIDATADIVHPDVMKLAKAQFLGERARWLAQEAGTLNDQGLRVDHEVRWAPLLHKALIDRVLQHRPDLVVKDLGQDHDAHQLFSPADWKTVRFCPAPLMLVRPQSAPLPRRILAAVDTSGDAEVRAPLNDAVVRAAQQLALFSEAAVHLVHAFPFRPPPPHSGDPRAGLDSTYESMRRADTERFRSYAARHQFADDRQHLLSGDPAPTIADFAERMGFDLLVAGSLYRTAFDRFFLGSTTEALLARARCDVLVVKPPQFLEELRRHMDLDALRKRQALLQ